MASLPGNMATSAPQHPPSARPAPTHAVNDTARAAHGDRSRDISANGATPIPTPAPQQPLTVAATAKKAKGKKAPDPIDAEKQLAAKIAQLEQEKVGDKEVEAEISGYRFPCCKKHEWHVKYKSTSGHSFGGRCASEAVNT